MLWKDSVDCQWYWVGWASCILMCELAFFLFFVSFQWATQFDELKKHFNVISMYDDRNPDLKSVVLPGELD